MEILKYPKNPKNPTINKLKTGVAALFFAFSLNSGAENVNNTQYNLNNTTLNLKQVLSNEDEVNEDKAKVIRNYIESNPEIQKYKEIFWDKFENLINQVIDSITLNIDNFVSIGANWNTVMNNQEIDKLINQILKNQDINHLSEAEIANLCEIIKAILFFSISFFILKKALLSISEEEYNRIRNILKNNLWENINRLDEWNNDNLNEIIKSRIDLFICTFSININKYISIEMSHEGLIKYKLKIQNFTELFKQIFYDLIPKFLNEENFWKMLLKSADQINEMRGKNFAIK